MSHRVRFTLLALCFFACSGAASAQLPGLSNNPSPELVGQLTKQLAIKPDQAIGGLGTIFGFAKTRLKPDDFLKIANVVPGMDGLLKAAPVLRPNANDPLSQMGAALPGKAGAIASMGGAFKQLGMSPQMAMKFLPVMTQFLKLKGGANVAGLLGGLFK